ncbi:MAG TPA: outer membrane lipoprotein carrier protein LolA [Pseudonocardiaceae bacterium]|jgi:outer membrane lipoprotein-sorting protein|nr:outer membrane lipoprotein carrier protein LolA [Pseudonocardiaceae bacterium]
MDRRKATLGAAAIGVVAGVTALVVVASPAGAGQSPTLPKTTPDALVQSVLTAQVPAMSGTVQLDNNLGLPAVPGLPQVATNGSEVRVWTDGKDRSRISIPSATSEQTIVDDGTTVYEWDSADRSVVEHSVHKAEKTASDKAKAQDLDPAKAARDLVGAIQKTSTISVDGTDVVAGRSAYDLVLTPKPQERTLLREVRVAVDAQTRIPLRLTVLAENTDSPALQIGFTSLDMGAQDPSLFHFSVPAGATVTNGDKHDQHSAEIASSTEPKLVGDGWDTVIVAQVPKAARSNSDSPNSTGQMLGLVRQIGTAVHGTWGSGWLISTDVGNAVITSDGRVAAGFVPQQLLYQALSK